MGLFGIILTVAVAAGVAIVLYAIVSQAGRPRPPSPTPEPAPKTGVLPDSVRPHRRSCWQPETIPGESGPDASKFAGLPVITAEHPWPVCPNCSEPMQLFVQIDLASAPGGFGKGLVQLFYCVNTNRECEIKLEGWNAFSNNGVARLVPHPGPDHRPMTRPANCTYPERIISSWLEKEDYPSPTEIEAEFGEGDYDYPLQGEKLGGWPFWVQNVEYPACPQCGRRMELLFQVDSENNLPWMFGDAGIGHITRCPDHADVLAFAWACS